MHLSMGFRRPHVRALGRSVPITAAVAAVLTASLLAAGIGTAEHAAAAAPTFVNGHPNPAADMSACATRAAGDLCVRAAGNSLLPGSGGGAGGQGPSKNDPVPTYKWLLSRDDTGGVTLGSDGKTPIASEVAACHPTTSTAPGGNANYPDGVDGSGPLLLDGTPNPKACPWPSVANITSSPVVSTGNQADWNPTTALPAFNATTGRGLPDGKYLVSVTANGYQIGGAHFTVTKGVFAGLDVNSKGVVVVGLNPLPIPLATIRLKVYGDMASTNAQWDESSEFGLPGFDGHLTDYDGPVSVDWYGNPLCTAYQLEPTYSNDHPDPTSSSYQVKLGLDGRPIIDPSRHIRGAYEVAGPSTGQCTSDGNGDIVIPYMAPNRYAASVISDKNAAVDPATGQNVPAQQTCGVLSTAPGTTATATPDQACWVQTTTLEGNHDFDAWPQANATGYDTELLVAGELVPEVQFGFVRAGCMANVTRGTVDFRGLTDPSQWLAPNDPRCASLPRAGSGPAPTGGIRGHIMGADAYYPGLGGLPGTGGNAGTAGYAFDRPVHHPWVTVSDLNNGDKTIWGSEANLDGTFSIAGVPDGSYSIAVWDQQQDYIFDSFNVTVSGGQVADLGTVPLLEWWTRITGHVCIDANGNGRCDPGEAGVPKFVLQNLDRTNNAQEGGQNTDVTDDQGYYEFTEAYPLGYNDVIQAFNTRFKTTGVTWQACNDPQEHTTLTPIVDVQYNPVIAQCGRLDWAVQPYAGLQSAPDPTARSDNGGIVATVFYDAVRTRLAARSQVAQDYFPGVPGVLTELFQPLPPAPANAPTTQVCNGVTVPNLSFDRHYLNCDGSFKTASTTAAGGVTNGGYATTYAGGAVAATDRYQAPGTVNAYQSEHYGRGTGCVARDANGVIISGSKQADGSVTGTQADGTTVTDFLPGLQTDPASANPGNYTQACIEAPATGVNFSLGTDGLPLDPNVPTGDAHGVQTVDGNFALTPTTSDGTPATGDFLVKVDVPTDKVLPAVDGADRPLYKVADETSMNNFAGANLAPWTADLGTGAANAPGHATTPEFVPQNADLSKVFDLSGASVHTNHGTCGTGACAAFSFPPQARKPAQAPVALPVTGGDSPTTYTEDPNTASPAPDPQCAGPLVKVDVTDPGFLSVGGSPLQGQLRNSCSVHLIHLGGGQSVAPNFYLYTDVPVPTTFIVQNFDDTNLSTLKSQTQYGDAAPLPNSPEGVYDWAGNLVDQTNTDPNGIAAVLMPSTDVANCATPAGICQNVYRFVGNDPGTIDHPNRNYDPQVQTITANFQALPGVFTPADTAPTRSALAFINGGQKFSATANCTVGVGVPQVFSVNRPYTDFSTAHGPAVVLRGTGFGTARGTVALTASGSGGTGPNLLVTSWTDSEIDATVPTTAPPGAYQLAVTTSAGRTTVNGVGYHVIGGASSSYHPTVLEVGPTFTAEPSTQAGWTAQRQFPSIQEALERAAGYWLRPNGATLAYTPERGSALTNALVVVYPAAPSQVSGTTATTPGVWYEPVILHSAVTLQGVGPGGVQPAVGTGSPTLVPGTVIDGRYYFSLADTSGVPAPIDWSTAPQDVRAQHAVDVWQTVANASYPKTPAPDNQLVTEGQDVTVLAQGDQLEYTASSHPAIDGFGLQGGLTLNTPANVNANTGQRTGPAGGADATQGGAIYLNGHDDWTRITDDVVDGNSGSYGAIRIGSPMLAGQHDWNIELGHDQIVGNGGNNLGGGLAIFGDSGGYSVHDNLVCGNQSAEYGGGMSQYGRSVAPVTMSAALSRDGRTLSALQAVTVGLGAFPFTAGDIGAAVSAPGLQGARITAVDAGRRTVTLSGANSANAFNTGGGRGSFRFVPASAAAQVLSNSIAHNTVEFNQSQDEGGGIMIAGELPTDVTKPSTGAGAVTISGNTIAVNAANDDGGGLRFLQAGTAPMRVENNMITDNVSSHEGGGISIDDTSQVTIIDDTIAKNITTATAATSNGAPAPAGISTAHNSAPFQAQLTAINSAIPAWSNPVIANDVLYDNRAGSWNAAVSNVTGVGGTGDTTPLNEWDIGIADPGLGQLSPVNSLLSTTPTAPGGQGYTASATNRLSPTVTTAADNYPNFRTPFDLQLFIAPMRINFRFRPTAIVNITLPAGGTGDYHVLRPSPGVVGIAASRLTTVPPPFTAPILAPTVDIDGTPRPASGADAGAAQTTAAVAPASSSATPITSGSSS